MYHTLLSATFDNFVMEGLYLYFIEIGLPYSCGDEFYNSLQASWQVYNSNLFWANITDFLEASTHIILYLVDSHAGLMHKIVVPSVKVSVRFSSVFAGRVYIETQLH